VVVEKDYNLGFPTARSSKRVKSKREKGKFYLRYFKDIKRRLSLFATGKKQLKEREGNKLGVREKGGKVNIIELGTIGKGRRPYI